MTLPLVVEMTVDTGNSYELSAETNQHEINLDNELEINVTSYDVPEYQGSYTVDAGLSPVVLNTQDKRLTQNVTVNALQAISPSSPSVSINNDNGLITATAYYPVGYNDLSFVLPTMKPLPTQGAQTLTASSTEQTVFTKGTFLTGNIKLAPITLPYADVSGVTASASDVLAGKYFVNNLGVLTLGTATAGGGDGAPMPVDTVAEMIDTTKVYLYVGSETGYTFGNWYYYNGTAWVSGGKWGADGGVNTNARNLLQYILERVAYTETDMEPYVTALYEALAQAGAVTTTYTITNALTNVTNSNTATGCEEGVSYTGTLTADTDYTIDTVTVTMGGIDITSTAYSNGVITIASVTGDIVITASAIIRLTGYIEVGSPTIADGILTVADGKFIKSNQVFSPGSSTWAVRCKARRTANLGSYADLFGSVDSNNASYRSFLYEFSASAFDGGSASMFASSNGTSWDITSSDPISNLPTAANTWIWYEMSFTGSSYVLKSSTDGSTWTSRKTINSTTSIIGGYAVGFGLKRNGVYKGDIDLSGCEIYIDGQLWWSAV